VRYRLRFHPAVSEDLDAIARWLVDHAGHETAARRLAEIDEVIASLQDLPYKGSIRDEIAPGLRAIPAGRKAVIAFTVDDETREVFIHVVSYAGADWIARSRARRG
jgi:plasmid stabilization system protein ParE